MPRMTLNFTIYKSKRSAEVTFLETKIGQFLYTRITITRSLTGVETKKGSKRVFALIPNLLLYMELQRIEWNLDLKKHKYLNEILATFVVLGELEEHNTCFGDERTL